MKLLLVVLLWLCPLSAVAQFDRLREGAQDQLELVQAITPANILTHAADNAIDELEDILISDVRPLGERYLSTYIALVKAMAAIDPFCNPRIQNELPARQLAILRDMKARLSRVADLFVEDGVVSSYKRQHAEDNARERKELSRLYTGYVKENMSQKREFYTANTLKYAILAMKFSTRINKPTILRLHTVFHSYRSRSQVKFAVNEVLRVHRQELPTPGSGCPGSLTEDETTSD